MESRGLIMDQPKNIEVRGARVHNLKSDAFYALFKFAAVAEGFVLDAVAVVVDGSWGIVEEFSDARALLDAEPDECEDAEGRGEGL